MTEVNFNTIYSLIVVGGSDAGTLCMMELLEKQPACLNSTLWVSTEFTAKAAKLIEKNNIPTLTDTVVYANYVRGLLVLEFKNSKQKIYCRKLIMAVGSVPKATLPEANGVYISYNTDKLYEYAKAHKGKDTLLFISDAIEDSIKAGLKFAKLYNKVIMITKEVQYSIPESLATKFKANSKHLQIIPGCELKKVVGVNFRMLCTLSTYTQITVDNILIETSRIPDLARITSPLITLDDNNIPKITNNYESIKIPTVYIINEPDTVSNIKKIITTITNVILSEEKK